MINRMGGSRFSISRTCTELVCVKDHVGVSLHEKRVLHVAGGVFGWKVQSTEHVPIVFDLWALRHGKAHVLENPYDFSANHLQRVMGAHRHAT